MIKKLQLKAKPTHSPPEEHEFPGNEGGSPAPGRQKTAFSNFQLGGGQAYRDQTTPEPNQKRQAKKAAVEEEMPISRVIGQGFTFAPKDRGKKIQAWSAKQKQNSTLGKASSVVQNMQNKNSLPPSLRELMDDLLQIMPPQNKAE